MAKLAKKDADGLTASDRRLADEYLVDLSIVGAAKRALGYEHKQARQSGWRILQKPAVQAYIQRRMKERSERVQVTQDTVLRGLHGIAADQAATESARVRAYELLGRMIGVSFKPEAAHPPPAAPRDEDLAGLSDDELNAEHDRLLREIKERGRDPETPKDQEGAGPQGAGRKVRNLRTH